MADGRNEQSSHPPHDGAVRDDDGARPPQTGQDQLAALIHRGHHHLTQGEAQEAADALEDAVILARDVGQEKEEAEAAGLLAQAYLRLGLPDEAAREAQAALTIAQARQDQAAAQHFEQLLLTARSSPDELEMSTAFGDGRNALQQGQPERAVELLEKALALAEKVGHRVAQAASTQLLAQAYHGADEQEKALEFGTRALEQAQACGDEQAAARATELLQQIQTDDQPAVAGLQAELEWGQTALTQGDMDRGIRHLTRAKELAQEQGQKIPEASACGLLAQAYLEQGQREDAAEQARQALAIAQRIGHEEAARDFQMLLTAAEADEQSTNLASQLHQGAAALERGEHQAALKFLDGALAIAKDTSHDVAEALACGLLAKTHAALGQQQEATAYATRAMEISRERGEDHAVNRFKDLLNDLLPSADQQN
jgi:tetratricopeptide (TPR) repeat protein